MGLYVKDNRFRKPCEFFLSEYLRPDGRFYVPRSKRSRSELCLAENLARPLFLSGIRLAVLYTKHETST